MEQKKARAWLFTINNWNETDEYNVKNINCRYICFGKEVGKLGTPHLQGYVYFDAARHFNSVRKMIRGNILIAKGTALQNRDYCSKDGIFWEKGDLPRQGKRNDLTKIKKLVKDGCSLIDIFEEAPNFQGFRMGEIGRRLYQQHRTGPPYCFWRCGLAGVGKSRYIFDSFNIEDIYVKDSTKWWDGYDQQKVILIDDFDGSWPYRDFLRLLDRYPYQGQVKGGYVKINSPYIFITCEFPPEYFWSENELAQVTRRLVNILYIVSTERDSGTQVGGNNSPDLDKELGRILDKDKEDL